MQNGLPQEGPPFLTYPLPSRFPLMSATFMCLGTAVCEYFFIEAQSLLMLRFLSLLPLLSSDGLLAAFLPPGQPGVVEPAVNAPPPFPISSAPAQCKGSTCRTTPPPLLVPFIPASILRPAPCPCSGAVYHVSSCVESLEIVFFGCPHSPFRLPPHGLQLFSRRLRFSSVFRAALCLGTDHKFFSSHFLAFWIPPFTLIWNRADNEVDGPPCAMAQVSGASSPFRPIPAIHRRLGWRLLDIDPRYSVT